MKVTLTKEDRNRIRETLAGAIQSAGSVLFFFSQDEPGDAASVNAHEACAGAIAKLTQVERRLAAAFDIAPTDVPAPNSAVEAH
jgi:hypothetical protein